jgi:hypothetical protein
MKKHIFFILLIVSVLAACNKVSYDGQTGKILHKKYSPALTISYVLNDSEQQWDTIRLDLDQDNTTDLKICFQYDTPYIIGSKDWELSVASDGYISEVNWWNSDYHVYEGQVLPICIRHTTEEGPCYGWLDCYSTIGSEGQVDAIRFYLRETAYCTCLNYPLKWGEK